MKPSNLRRSTRLTIAVPVSVSGTDAQGNAFSESTRTITVNRHGGKLLLGHEVRVKDSVKLTSVRLGRTVNAVVVWLGKRRTESDPREVAVELLDPGNIWGVDFPPADWNEASSIRDLAPHADSASPAPVDAVGSVAAARPAHVESAKEVGTPAEGSARVSNGRPHEAAPPPPVPSEGTSSFNSPGSNGNGKGSDLVLSELTESVNRLLQTSLANFEEELDRTIKIHTKAFDKRAFGTAMDSVETARKEIQQAVPGLVQDAIAQFRCQVQKDMETFATYLEELKQRATDDATSALRSRVAAALKALEG